MAVAAALLLTGCLTDAATRLGYDLQSGAARVGRAEGARHTVVHEVPSKRGECTGPYRVQFDRVGAIIVWCYDASGKDVVSSHSTSHHADRVDTAETRIVDKPAGESLSVVLERRGGRPVIVDAR